MLFGGGVHFCCQIWTVVLKNINIKYLELRYCYKCVGPKVKKLGKLKRKFGI